MATVQERLVAIAENLHPVLIGNENDREINRCKYAIKQLAVIVAELHPPAVPWYAPNVEEAQKILHECRETNSAAPIALALSKARRLGGQP